MNKIREERLQIMLSPAELEVIDNFRFLHRMPTRAAAIRELLKLGLAASGSPIADGSKSSNYGVLGRGPNSHAEGDET
ncbi:MAG: hypothetical protein ACTHN2_09350 [Nitrobacter sp.]|jgi:hypothetical protein